MLLDLIANIAYGVVMHTYRAILTVPVPHMELNTVMQVEAKPASPMWSPERHCRYSGVAIPIERDWEIVSENSMTHSKSVIPAEPGQIYEYAFLFNKKACPGKSPELVYLTGSVGQGIFKGKGIVEGRKVMITTLSGKSEEQPKWLPQAAHAIEAAEATKPFVKAFLDFSRAGTIPASEVAAQTEVTAAESTEISTAQ